MPAAEEKREVSDQDKALAADLLKRIEAAGKLVKDDEKRFADNRKWLRGVNPHDGSKLRTNLHFANLASMRPQVYAKNPEFAVTPTKAVPEEQIESWRAFGETAEAVLDTVLVRNAKLKKRAKRILTSAYTAAVGWWKVCWQEDRKTDPIIDAKLKDTQDNIARLERLKAEAGEASGDVDLKLAQAREAMAGLQGEAEKQATRGCAVDFVLPEDIRVLDVSVREIEDYERSSAIAHRVWMTRDRYKEAFGYEPTRAKAYTERAGQMHTQGETDKASELVAVWEVWEQASSRVMTVCEGEEGFCRPPYSPDWTGERWYPYFLLCFNAVDGGGLFPPSDIDLTEKVVSEYNETRDNFERDRRKSLPLNVVRKGGSLTPEDVQRLANRSGDEWAITVDGPGGRPLSDDIFVGQLAQLRPENYDTTPARTDMEMLVGGGDATRGAVMTAKTATEAEILAQGMRGRSAERTDAIEDLMSEVGRYVLEMCLRKLSLQEVQAMAGIDAQWPQLRADEVFDMVHLSVRGGSTGKPDRLQDQDRWTTLLPVIEKAMAQIAELRAAGQNGMAEAATELVRETLRRFDERIDIDRFLPVQEQPQDGEGGGEPQITPEMLQEAQAIAQEMQAKIAELEQALQDKAAEQELQREKVRADAVAKVQIARETAPIEAQAAIEKARIEAEAKMTVDAERIRIEAENGAAQRENEATGNAEMEAIRAQMAEFAALQQQFAQAFDQMAAMLNQPKPRMKVQHRMDPATGRLLESALVPDEEQA